MGCWSFLIGSLRGCARRGHASAADFSSPGPTRPYADDLKALEQTVKWVLQDPEFRIDRQFGDMRCEVHLRYPGSQAVVSSHSVKRVGDLYLKYDFCLNGKSVYCFNPFGVLRQRMAQAVLARIGLGPVSSIAIRHNPASAGAEADRPVAITASRSTAGTEFEIFRNPAKTAAFLQRTDLRPALAAAYVLGMSDVVKPQLGSVHNLLCDPRDGRWQIIDGFDVSDVMLGADLLQDKRISALFGMSRADLLEIVEQAGQATMDFADAHAAALRHVDKSMAGNPHATAPLDCFADYLQGCRQRIGGLED